MDAADNAAQKPLNKTQILQHMADATGTDKKQVGEFFDELAKLIEQNLKDGPGVFTLPGLLKIKVVRKPATPEREGIDPFTKQPKVFAAKPAKNVVKAQPLKGLKDMV